MCRFVYVEKAIDVSEYTFGNFIDNNCIQINILFLEECFFTRQFSQQ